MESGEETEDTPVPAQTHNSTMAYYKGDMNEDNPKTITGDEGDKSDNNEYLTKEHPSGRLT